VPEPREPLVVAPLPPPPEDNSAPYLRLLHEALARHGVKLLRVDRPGPALARDRRLDAVHLHWLEYLTKAEGPRGLRTLRAQWRLARLLASLAALRRSGKRVVWTVHNIRPHESRHPWLDRLTARVTACLADALIVHSRYAAGRVEGLLGASGKLHVIPHGHFRDLYPASRTRLEVRAALGIPEAAFTYLVFGQLRAYKLVPEAVRAFRSLPDPHLRLMVAGASWDDRVRERIVKAADSDDRVLLRLEFVPDDEVAELHLAADAAVIAYREVFSSGALLLALGFGLPVVAPAESTAPEVAAGPALETFAPGALRAALDAVRRGDPARRREAALRAATECSWEAIAEETACVYRGARAPDR
jgi:beta-1,4-mannosyltransferase